MTSHNEERRRLSDRETQALVDDGGHLFENPLWVAGRFFALVRNLKHLELAASLVTPQSRHLWSPCFQDEHRLLQSVAGVSDLIDYTAPSVCAVRLPAGVEPGYEYPPGALRRGLILTLVHDAEHSSGGWRVHHLGDYQELTALPRAAPYRA